MMKFLLCLFILSIQLSLAVSQEMKPLDNYLTKKDTDFKEVTVRKVLEDIFGQMEPPYSIVLPANDPELVKTFEDAKVTLRISAGIPYEELIRHVLLSAGLNYKLDGGILRILTEEQDIKEQPEISAKTYRLTKKELSVLGLLDDRGEVNMVAMRKWLNLDGEAFGHQKGGTILVIRASREKVEALNALLSLHRLGYEIPTLYSTMNTQKQ